jgi:hypothetical protein
MGFVLLPSFTAKLLAQTAAVPPPIVRVGGYLQARETYESGVGLTGSINRARLVVSGTIVPAVSWRISGEFRTGGAMNRATVSLQDAVIRYVPDPWSFHVGQFKTPFTREFLTSIADLESADRSAVVDTLAPKRDIGIMGEYALRSAVTATVGLFGGDGQNTTVNRDSTLLAVVRVSVRPAKHVGIGANIARYFGDSTRYGVDANYHDSTLTVRAEFVSQTRDAGAGPADKGWYGLIGGFLVRQIQLVGKYEYFDQPGVANSLTQRAWTAAANLYPWNADVRLTLEYISRQHTRGTPWQGMGLAQVQVKF